MTTYYVDPTATGDNDGGGDGVDRDDPTESANWTNAWESMADAIAGTNGTAPTAGDVVYRKHTNTPDETLTAGITNNLSGNNTSGYIQWITVNSSGVIDGSRYHLDGAGTNTGTYLYSVTGANNLDYGLYVDDADTSNLGVTGSYNVFMNLLTEYADSYGVISTGTGSIFISIVSQNNVIGVVIQQENRLLFSRVQNNSNRGVTLNSVSNVAYGNLVIDNSNEGIYAGHRSNLVLNNVVDNNSLDNILVISGAYSSIIIIGNRLTESGEYGIDFNTQKAVLALYNYTPASTEDRDNASGATNGLPDLKINSLLGNIWNGTDTNAGYNNPTSDDFNLTSTASLRRTKVELP